MRAISKIAAWAIMSLAISTTAVAGTAFGLKQHDYNPKSVQHSHELDPATQRQLACLARNVWYEAGAESMRGMMAVAQVTINRSRSNHWPNDLCAVVAQSHVANEKRVCQFSWYCDPSKNKNKVIGKNNPAYIAARRVFLDGQRIPELGYNTFFFHSTSVMIPPGWPHEIIMQIGNHVFYRR